ncbi:MULTISPECIES: phage tail domain-containing protein [unclassified Streptomyces]|uniref:phage tail domain-containing protein n=1 Tax=unclassified Streptomyces TaxID=2593676 RepID=UPI000891EB8B|nr:MULTISPECIES: phage tail domain-containing protein [unclassified Streptomyces]PBC72240.1 tail protein [Streptomyces sp. 2321.6]SDR62001.1 Phage tail protein [Streptomyces sp. KS_16]SEE49485.1 Phage tail protein [Streptomyces sp. 2133.1]SNC77745.1 Phage tail protein [Streptomyces sp. 2114.4]
MPDIDLEEGQWDLGGILMGTGTPVRFKEITGLGWPGTRDSDVDQPSADGAFPGPDYYTARTIEFDANIRVPGNGPACEAILAQMQAAADDPTIRLVGGATMPLRVRRPGSDTRRVNGRLRRLAPEMATAIHGFIPVDMAFEATDPTWYGDAEQTVDIPLGWMTGGGFTAPVFAPIFVTSATEAAVRPGWVTNAGTRSTWPVLRIQGPCSNVTITHVASGRTLTLPTLTLTAEQWVELDTRPGRLSVVRENGGNAETYLSPASRLDQFSLPPGQSEMRWTAVDPTNSARLSVTWRDAYTAL